MVQKGTVANSVFTPSKTYLTGPMGPMYVRHDDLQNSYNSYLEWYILYGMGSVLGEVITYDTRQSR